MSFSWPNKYLSVQIDAAITIHKIQQILRVDNFFGKRFQLLKLKLSTEIKTKKMNSNTCLHF